ncbi:MAG: hypothetical protein ACQER9_01650 [Nanobdellota archaeon]
MKDKYKKFIVLGITLVFLAAFYVITNNISPDTLKELGLSIPLPLFTFLIAFVDGFNPCNLFVLTLLLSLILSESHSRKKIYAVGFSFIAVIFLFYYLFMAAWLNIFNYIGFIDPLRIGIALLAIIAGVINCKEYFFYRKGITLMIQDRYVAPVKKKIKHVADMMKKSSVMSLIGASVVLAIFASLVELPCTAGFPIIYTGILTGAVPDGGLLYYLYLILYNFVYVIPLLVIITVLGYTFKGKAIKKETMSLIKFIGGAIMLLLGIILLFNPGLIGI